MDRRTRRLVALGWLLLLHLLADLTVALYRCLNLNRDLTDCLAAVLMRSQFVLLLAWLVLGLEPFTWRLCGAVSGTALLFIIYTQLLFPGLNKPEPGPFWHQTELHWYFRPSNPGDFLLKAPVLIGATGVPLLAWRIASAIRQRVEGSEPFAGTGTGWMQYRFQDFFVWILALCILLTALSVPPHRGWPEQIYALWLRGMQLKTEYAWFTVLSGLPTACILLATLQASRWCGAMVRQLRSIAIVGLTTSLALDLWWDVRIAVQPMPSEFHDRPSETAVAFVSAAVICGTVWLFVQYDRTPQRQPYRPVRPGRVHARLHAGRSTFIRSRTARNKTPTACESAS